MDLPACHADHLDSHHPIKPYGSGTQTVALKAQVTGHTCTAQHSWDPSYLARRIRRSASAAAAAPATRKGTPAQQLSRSRSRIRGGCGIMGVHSGPAPSCAQLVDQSMLSASAPSIAPTVSTVHCRLPSTQNLFAILLLAFSGA